MTEASSRTCIANKLLQRLWRFIRCGYLPLVFMPLGGIGL
jgi:hypothetical protein